MMIIMMFTALLMALDKVLETGTYLIPNVTPPFVSIKPKNPGIENLRRK